MSASGSIIKVFLYEIDEGKFRPFCFDSNGEVLDIYEKGLDNKIEGEQEDSEKNKEKSTPDDTQKTIEYNKREKNHLLHTMMVTLLENKFFKHKNKRYSIDKVLKEIELTALNQKQIDTIHTYHAHIFNEDKKNEPYPFDAIAIVFTTMESLTLPETYKNFVEMPFRKIMDENKNIFNRQPLPVIMIGTKDIMGIYIEEKAKNPDVIYSLNLDDRFKFFDSSIWHYYVPINEKFEDLLNHALIQIQNNFDNELYQTNVSLEDLEIQMRMLLNSYIVDFGSGHGKKVTPFKFHSEQNIRRKTKELWEGDSTTIGLKDKIKGLQWRFLLIDDYANKPLKKREEKSKYSKSDIIRRLLEEVELNTTIFQSNSFITNNSNDKQKIPISRDVLIVYKEPIERKAVDEMRNCLEQIGFKIGILRDEKASNNVIFYKEEHLQQAQTKVLEDFRKIVIDSSATSTLIQQEYIINFTDKIKHYSPIKDIEIKSTNQIKKEKYTAHIAIEYAHNLQDAESLLRQRKFKIYDIILLDYLLNDESNQPEYGTTLLKDIHENLRTEKGGHKFQASVLNNFWVFPTSSFSYAMLDAIYERGISHFDEHWFLASGADPVDTPEMFKFKLLKFIQAQLGEAGYEEISRGNTTEQANIFDYLKSIFSEEDIAQNARKHYPEMVRLHSKFDDLYQNRSKSLFAASMVKIIYKGLTADMWNHLLHLTYLIGYGNASQWPQMWEEYKLLKTRFKKEKIAISGGFEYTFENLSNYISSLKAI